MSKIKIWSWIIISAAALPFLPLTAQEEKTEFQIYDYSKGFEVFYRLGLPDVSKADYVTVSLKKQPPSMANTLKSGFGLKGNAWFSKAPDGKSETFIFSNAINLDPETVDSSREAGLKEDIDKILAILRGKKYLSNRYHGNIFLYALQIHSKGFKTEANEIVSRLFESAKDRKIILLAAMNALADAQYIQAILDLQSHKNWKKFESDLDSLLKRYPKGWQWEAGTKVLLQMVHQQTARTAPPEIKGEGISDEDKKLADQLIYIKEIPYKPGWLLNVKRENKDNTGIDAIGKIMQKGKDAIPLFIALLQDERMTFGYSCNSNDMGLELDGDELTKKSIKRFFYEITHPQRIKDIARFQLETTVTIANNKNLTDKEFEDLCSEWYQEIKDMSDDELLCFYLKTGNNFQQNLAMTLLLEGDLKKNAAAIEDSFLTKPKRELMGFLLFRYAGISQYIIKRKKEALPFIAKLKEKFKYEIAEAGKNDKAQDDDREYEKDESGETLIKDRELQKKLKETLEILTELTAGKDPRKIIDEILAENNNMTAPWSQRLISGLAGRDADEVVSIFLYGALKTNNKYLKKNFISQLTQFLAFKKVPIATGSPVIGNNAADWKKLLDDKTECITETGEQIPINVSSAIAIECIYGTMREFTISEMKKELGERIDKLLLKRAEERLAGKTEKELTPWPQIKMPDTEARKKLADKLGKAIEDKKTGEFITSLSDNEFAALPDILAKNPGLNNGVKSYANRIVSVESPNNELDKFKAAVLNKAEVEKLQEYCLKLASENKTLVCIINREPALGGVSIALLRSEDEISGMLSARAPFSFRKIKRIPTAETFMFGVLNCISGSTIMRWEINKIKDKEIVTDGKKIKLEKNNDNNFKENWAENMGKLFEDAGLCTRSFNIRYTYIAEEEEQN